MPRHGFETRLLSESEILKIREMTLHGIERSRFAKAGRPPGIKNRRRDPIGAIMRRALAGT